MQRFYHCCVCGLMIDLHYQPAISLDDGKTWIHGSGFYKASWDCYSNTPMRWEIQG